MKHSNPLPIQAIFFQWTLFILLGFIILAINRYSNIDWQISSLFFDTNTQVFPLKNSRRLDLIMHQGIKWACVMTWIGMLGLTVHLQFGKPRNPAQAANTQIQKLVYVLASSILCAFLVGVLKSRSTHSCPWDLLGLGGQAPYFRLFETPLLDSNNPGKCFPSGHASVAWMWIPLLYAGIWPSRKAKYFQWAVLMVLGLLTGITQVIRGAHFPTHVLSTIWICWGVSYSAYLLWQLKSLHRQAVRLF